MSVLHHAPSLSNAPLVEDLPLRIGGHELSSRLIVGTGKYDTLELMRDSLAASEPAR